MPLILPGNVGSATATTGYEVANSVRFNESDDPRLAKTLSSSGNRRTFTQSVWIKRSKIGSAQTFGMYKQEDSSAPHNYLFVGYFDTNDRLYLARNQSATEVEVITTRKFRDVSAWYNIVIAVDTTQGTASNRVKCWVNGVQETTFDTATYPSQNQQFDFNNAKQHYIGANFNGTQGNYSGYIAEFVFVDGQALDQTSFGEFDSDSPNIWKPIDVSGLTFGTNGFYLDFEDSSALGNDVSGQNNDWTPTNLASTDQSTDTCTNNAITFNPLDVTSDDEPTLSEGNLKAVADGAFHQQRSTFYLTSGKWYWEFKPTTVGDAMQGGVVGSNYAGGSGLRRNYSYNGRKYTDGSSASYGATYTANDIIGVALDLDNGTLIFYKNGASQGTAYTDMLSAIGQDGWTPDVIIYNSTVEMNFGSPPYSISSGNSDANGHGNFEYSVPSGYYALNTKNLAEFG